MFTTVPVAERRPTRRLSLHVPLRVRVWQSAVPEQKVEYFNISERGVYFAGGTRFREGEQLELILRMPEEIVEQARANWRCLGPRRPHQRSRFELVGAGRRRALRALSGSGRFPALLRRKALVAAGKACACAAQELSRQGK
jgi:hypothetical protein